ncbi:DMT family transporter [Paenibacillus paeoniae]|uniref:DMT family transporter n=1 Tax=Paenibacillus paeoniae TaxID=2292705 RepID=A0A371PN40_9BACL|nr:DMT family transporter [Paenibacillus paeoniae]REK77581.1 DMT family transporter [Paenibacillus paeoniae]
MNQLHGMKLAYAAITLNAVIVGFSFLFTKMALQQATPLDTLVYRFAISFAVMTIPVLFGQVKLNFRGKRLLAALPLAALYPLGFFTLQTFGLQHATSSEGGILYAFTPVLTMIIASLFLRERTTAFQKLSIFLSAFGVVFIFAMKGSGIDWSNMTGILLLFLSCLTSAGYSVLARSLLKTFKPAEVTYLMLGIGFMIFLIASVTNHTASGTLHTIFEPLLSGTFIISVLYLGIFSSLLTALTANYALSKLEASKVGVFSNLSTIVSIVAGAAFLKEEITIYALIGSIMIIAGVMGTNRMGRRSKTINYEAKKKNVKA